MLLNFLKDLKSFDINTLVQSEEQDITNVDPLEPLRNLPYIVRMLITLIIGRPCPGIEQFVFPVFVHLGWSFVTLVFGVGICSIGIERGGLSICLIPLGWFFSLHSLRLLRLTLQHAAAHNAVFLGRRANLFFGIFVSILTLSIDFITFKRGHLREHHNSQKLMTSGDETYEFWTSDIGLEPGMSPEQTFLLLALSLISPAYHFRRFLKRVRGCIFSPYWVHNLYALIFWVIILSFIAWYDIWRYFWVAWFVPVSVLFECSSVLRQAVEHRHKIPTDDRMTGAIWLADLPPKFTKNVKGLELFFQWSWWWFRFFVIHVPVRFLVLPGDSPNHPKHHIDPGDKNWAGHIFKPSQSGDYPENWGLLSAITDTLVTWSLQVPDTHKSCSRESEYGDYLLEDYLLSKHRLDDCCLAIDCKFPIKPAR